MISNIFQEGNWIVKHKVHIYLNLNVAYQENLYVFHVFCNSGDHGPG